jgi:hypothetical protein
MIGFVWWCVTDHDHDHALCCGRDRPARRRARIATTMKHRGICCEDQQ